MWSARPGRRTRPQAVFERHHLKGAKEQGFSEVLSGLDLHHPPCQDLIANQAFYAIGMLAHNVLISLRVLDLPDEAQSWRIHTIIRHLLTVPVSVSTPRALYSGAHLRSGGLDALVAAVSGQVAAQAQGGPAGDGGGGLDVATNSAS